MTTTHHTTNPDSNKAATVTKIARITIALPFALASSLLQILAYWT